MSRKIIITLKEPINNGRGATHSICCDSLVGDIMTPNNCIEYFVDGSRYYVPIPNVLGTYPNPEYVKMKDVVSEIK